VTKICHLHSHHGIKTRTIKKIMALELRPPVQRIQTRNGEFCCKWPLQSPQTTRAPNRPQSIYYSTLVISSRTLRIISDQGCSWSLYKRKRSTSTHLEKQSTRRHSVSDIPHCLLASTWQDLRKLPALGWIGASGWADWCQRFNWHANRLRLLLRFYIVGDNMGRNRIWHDRRASLQVSNLVLDFKCIANFLTKKTVTIVLTFVFLLFATVL